MKKVTTSGIVILMLTNLAGAYQTPQMSATEIINRVIGVYASCTSYVDEGQSINESPSGRRMRRSFSTAFSRPGNFRLETFTWLLGVKNPIHHIAWSDGAKEKSWPTPWRLITDEPTLTPSSMTVLPRGPERFIKGLLVPERQRENILGVLSDLQVAKQDRLDGRLAFRIDGAFRGQATSVWIDQQRFLVIKIYQQEGVVRTTTLFKPQINVPISADRLAFNPPSLPAPNAGSSKVEVIDFSRSELVKRRGSRSVYLDYVHKLKIRNRGTQTIAGLAWDYVAVDPANKSELSRQSLFSYRKVEPTATETLNAKVFTGQSKVISAGSGDPGGQQSSSESVQVRCVVYTDGSWWKDPAAREDECEYFRTKFPSRLH